MMLETVLPWQISVHDELAIDEAGTVEYFFVVYNDRDEQFLVLQNVEAKAIRYEYSEFVGIEIKRKKRYWVVVSILKGRMAGWSTKRFAADRTKTAGEWWTPNIDHAYIYDNIFMAKAYAKKLKFGEPEVFEIDEARKIDTNIEFR